MALGVGAGSVYRFFVLAPATVSLAVLLGSQDSLQTDSATETGAEHKRYTVSHEGEFPKLHRYHGAPLNSLLSQEEARSEHETAALLEYWVKPVSKNQKEQKQAVSADNHPTYFTFETDIGGLNNMRLLFEYIVDVTANSKRTLVLPPTEGWYLIDWGATNSHNPDDEMRLPDGKDHTWSNYSEFFDIKSLSEKIPIMTAAEFYQKEKARFNIPDSADPSKSELVNSPDMNSWKEWLRRHATRPTISGDEEGGCEGLRSLVSTSALLVHVPCSSTYQDEDHPEQQYRYRFFDCGKPINSELLHFNPWFFEMAAVPVSQLKFGKYAALHLRRNEFQYAQAPSAEGSASLLQDMEKHLEPGEPVYIASDEVDNKWWDGFREALAKSGHRMYSAKDFEAELEARGVDKHRKLPTVEMLLCSGARVFLGTKGSTFTSGIQELRDKIAKTNEQRLIEGSQLLELGQEERGQVQHYHAEKLYVHI